MMLCSGVRGDEEEVGGVFRPGQGLLVVSEGQVKCMNLGKVNWIRDHEKNQNTATTTTIKTPKHYPSTWQSEIHSGGDDLVQSERNEVVTPRATNTSLSHMSASHLY